jgi:hypothetical protein
MLSSCGLTCQTLALTTNLEIKKKGVEWDQNNDKRMFCQEQLRILSSWASDEFPPSSANGIGLLFWFWQISPFRLTFL